MANWSGPYKNALELKIKRVDESLETSNFQHSEIGLEAIIHWVKHLEWCYIDVAYPMGVAMIHPNGWMGPRILQRLTSGRTHLRHFQQSLQRGFGRQINAC